MQPPLESCTITRVEGDRATTKSDLLAVEEPLEIRVGERPVSVTLRTPGDDFELATGFLVTESVIHRREDVESLRHWGSPNVVRVALAEGVRPDLARLQRNFYSTSSCGVCGKTSIDAIRIGTTPLPASPAVRRDLVGLLPHRLTEAQPAFRQTGGIHAAGAFTSAGELVDVREDVGRHNAADKVIGALVLTGRTADILVVSGRTSFEIVQKCVLGRIPVLVAVGAPSSLAVSLAREMNLTLVGFAREGRFNVYAGEERVK